MKAHYEKRDNELMEEELAEAQVMEAGRNKRRM